MKRRRGLAAWAIIAIAVSSLTGCAPGACATAAGWPPGVWLDPSPWLSAHPGSALTVCLDGNCKTADATTTFILQLTVPYRSPAPQSGNATYPLSITSRGANALKVQTHVTLHESHVTSPCGTQTWWQADARLSATGHLTIWHGTEGPFAPQVRRTMTSRPTATN